MRQVNEKGEIFYTNLDEHFSPRENFSSYSLRDKWRVVPVGTAEYTSNMLASLGGHPDDITLSPNLKGWYKIYLHTPGQSVLHLKLTSDPCFTPATASLRDFYTMEEFLWRCADMTGQSLTLTRRLDADNRHSMLAAVRFVPMSEEEVAEYQREESRTDTKRLYVTDDMHGHFYFEHPRTLDDWRAVALNYLHSDAEWLSIEWVRKFVSSCDLPTENTADLCFPRAGDLNVQEQYPLFDFNEVLKTVISQGHKQGLKMSVSLRMGAWGTTYPFDQYYFECNFMKENPQWRTFDRNGDEIAAMSYAYEGVQKFIVDELLNMARTGCDAVTLIAHRGIPYVLYEKPVADRFFEMYGEYPYELPLDEPRLNALHCDILTDFFRRARAALDAEFGKGKIQLHLRTLYSPYDTKYIGIDVEELAREGLIDAIVSYPQRFHEMLAGDVWKDEAHTRIDLEKYTNYVRTSAGATIHPSDCELLPPIKNSRGELCGPDGQQEHVAEWMALEKQYGVKVYIEIMPRYLSNEEFKRRALDLYACGAERIGLWDAYGRLPMKAMWSTAGRLGHKDELTDMDVGEGAYYRRFRIYRMAGADISRYEPFWGG